MGLLVIKRDGSEDNFRPSRIFNAVASANEHTEKPISYEELKVLTKDIINRVWSMNRAVEVEAIQDIVEDEIVKHNHPDLARTYIKYRYEHALMRQKNSTDERILSLIEANNEDIKQENANKNPIINSTQRDYMAGEVSKDITKRYLVPEDIWQAHEQGLIHFHDADYFAQHMHNCCLVNLDDMLQNGTVISGTLIEKPHSFSTACNITTQIIAQIASNQYGGQSISLTHLAPFVEESRKRIREEVKEEIDMIIHTISSKKIDGLATDFRDWGMPNENPYFIDLLYGVPERGKNLANRFIDIITKDRLKQEIRKGVQTLQYQIVTLLTTNGQTPFVTVYMDLSETEDEKLRKDLALIIEEVLNQRIQGVKNEKGVYITPAFPKLIYALDECNVEPDSPYFYLTRLAAQCTAKRMVPDYISAKKMRELKVNGAGHGDVYPCMGCRSFLTPDSSANGFDNIACAENYDGKPKYYGRFNQGVVTLNLVDIACSSGRNEDLFWDIFDERCELCYRTLMIRHERLEGTPSDVAPILWQHGALARLKKGEVIDPLLHNGYSTISLGYAGLCECVRYMTGHSHTEPEGKLFGLQVMQTLNDKCKEWKKRHPIDFSLYGTPIESTTYKFAKRLQERFGIIEGVTDKNYITNSYHVHVTEDISAFDKLKFESEFQALSPGGAISYVEVPNMENNIEAVLSLIHYIYDTILYAELNTKSDYCQVCGYSGEIQIVKDDNSKLVWECPNCKNRDQNKMNVARRTCGYIGTSYFNQGRTEEISERKLHL